MPEAFEPYLSGDPFTGRPWGNMSSDLNDLYNAARPTIGRDPLVLDLDGDGIEAVGINSANPILFDHNADTVKTATGWIKADDGILVLDRNGNGTIDSGRELFGDNTLLTTGAYAGLHAANGFQALADLDTNADKKVDSADAAYAQLRVWQDTNQDGISQAGELKTLSQLGIASISTVGVASNINLGNGNTQPLSATTSASLVYIQRHQTVEVLRIATTNVAKAQAFTRVDGRFGLKPRKVPASSDSLRSRSCSRRNCLGQTAKKA